MDHRRCPTPPRTPHRHRDSRALCATTASLPSHAQRRDRARLSTCRGGRRGLDRGASAPPSPSGRSAHGVRSRPPLACNRHSRSLRAGADAARRLRRASAPRAPSPWGAAACARGDGVRRGRRSHAIGPPPIQGDGPIPSTGAVGQRLAARRAARFVAIASWPEAVAAAPNAAPRSGAVGTCASSCSAC